MSQITMADQASIQATQQALSNINSIPADQYALDNSTQSAIFKKETDLAMNIEAKMQAVKDLQFKKSASMDGYKESEIELIDGESGFEIERDSEGNIINRRPIRFQSSQPYSAITPDSVRSKRNVTNDPEFVASITGKDVTELTDKDFNDVAAWHKQELYKGFTATADEPYSFSPFNARSDYSDNRTIKTMLKYNGSDADGNSFVSAINPETGTDIAFEASNNPYLNASFSVFNHINTASNRKALNRYETARNLSVEDFDALYGIDKSASDGRVGEFFDQIQSAGYQTVARFLGTDLAGKLGSDIDYWRKVASEEGQAIADAWAGVSPSTRRDFAKNMMEARSLWEEGHYIDSILTYASQIDRVLADSMPQMAEIAIGSALTGGATAFLGSGALAGMARGFLSAGLLAGTEQTIMDNEKFTANFGREMNSEEMARSWFVNSLSLAPDALLQGIAFKRFLPSSLQKLFGSGELVPKASLTSGMRALAVESGGEFIQEPIQNAISEANANTTSDMDWLAGLTEQFQGENLAQRREEAILGALSAGAMTGTANVVTAPVRTVQAKVEERKANKSLEAMSGTGVTQTDKITGTTEEVDISAKDTKIAKTIGDMFRGQSHSTKEAVLDSFAKLQNQINNDAEYNDLSHISKADRLQLHSAMSGYVRDSINKIFRDETDTKAKQEFFEKLSDRYGHLFVDKKATEEGEELNANPKDVAQSILVDLLLNSGNSDIFTKIFNAGQTLNDEAKSKLQESTREFISNILEIMPDLDVNRINAAVNDAKHQATQAYDSGNGVDYFEVNQQVKDSLKGYNDYDRQLTKIDEQLAKAKDDTALTSRLINAKNEVIRRLTNLSGNQFEKFKNFVTAIEKMAIDGNITSMEVKYPNGKKGFKLWRKSIWNGSNPMNMIDFIKDDVQSMMGLLEKHSTVSEERKSELQDLLSRYKEAVSAVESGVLLKPNRRTSTIPSTPRNASESSTTNENESSEQSPTYTRTDLTKGYDNVLGNQFVNHSGGARGSDTVWGEIGAKWGVKSNHYYHKKRTPSGNVAITRQQYKEGYAKYLEAAKALQESETKNDYTKGLMARNWQQVANADAVFAVSRIVDAGTEYTEQKWDGKKHVPRKVKARVNRVAGGTGYAVQMAISEGKPVYVFNQSNDTGYEVGWYAYNPTTKAFEPTEEPMLTKNFAGIGTREINKNGRAAIENIYRGTMQTIVRDEQYTSLRGVEQQVPVSFKRTLELGAKDGKVVLEDGVYYATDADFHSELAIHSKPSKGSPVIFINRAKLESQGLMKAMFGESYNPNSGPAKMLFKIGITANQFVSLFKDNKEIEQMLVRHEKSHISHRDGAGDFNSIVEARATVESLNEEQRALLEKMTGKKVEDILKNLNREIKSPTRETPTFKTSFKTVTDWHNFLRENNIILHAIYNFMGGKATSVTKEQLTSVIDSVFTNKDKRASLVREFQKVFEEGKFRESLPIRVDGYFDVSSIHYQRAVASILTKAIKNCGLADDLNNATATFWVGPFIEKLKDRRSKIEESVLSGDVSEKAIEQDAKLRRDIINEYGSKVDKVLKALKNSKEYKKDPKAWESTVAYLEDTQKLIEESYERARTLTKHLSSKVDTIISNLETPMMQAIALGLNRHYYYEEANGKRVPIIVDKQTAQVLLNDYIDEWKKTLANTVELSIDGELAGRASNLFKDVEVLERNVEAFIANQPKDAKTLGGEVVSADFIESVKAKDNALLIKAESHTFSESDLTTKYQKPAESTSETSTEEESKKEDDSLTVDIKQGIESELKKSGTLTISTEDDIKPTINSNSTVLDTAEDQAKNESLLTNTGSEDVEPTADVSKNPAEVSERIITQLDIAQVNKDDADLVAKLEELGIRPLNEQFITDAKSAASRLAFIDANVLKDCSDPVVKSWASTACSVANKIKFVLKKGGVTRRNSGISLGKDVLLGLLKEGERTNKDGSKEKIPADLTTSGYLRLLYQFVHDSEKGTTKLVRNDNVVLATDLAVREFLVGRNINDTFDPKESEAIARAFSLDDKDLIGSEVWNLRDLVTKHGVPRTKICEMLGGIVLNNLGIFPNSKADHGFYENVKSGLGMYALEYAAARGMIEFDEISREELTEVSEELFTIKDSKGNISKASVPSVKFVQSGIYGTEYTEIFKELQSRLGTGVTSYIKPHPYTHPITKVSSTKRNSIGMGISEEQAKVCDKLNHMAYSISPDFIESLGITESMTYDEVLSKLSHFKTNTDASGSVISGYTNMDDFHGTKQSYNSHVGANKSVDDNLQGLAEAICMHMDAIRYKKARRAYLDKIDRIPNDTRTEYSKDSISHTREFVEGKIQDRLQAARREFNEAKFTLYNGTEIDFSREHIGGKNLYFRHYFIKSDRIMIESSGINPQTNKFLRFILLPKNFVKTFKMDDESMLGDEAYATAQAFDALKGRDKVTKVGKAFNDFIKKNGEYVKNAKELIDQFTSNATIFFEKYGEELGIDGIENYGQCINVLQHYINKAKALEAGKTEFDTQLAVEIDSTTSGYYLKMSEYPHPILINTVAPLTGLFTRQNAEAIKENIGIDANVDIFDMSIDELKKTPGFQDIYKTAANGTMYWLEEHILNEDGTINDEKVLKVFKEHFKGSEQKAQQAATAFKKIYSALPTAGKQTITRSNAKGENIQVTQFIISSALRTLMKYPTMIFSYAGGKRGITAGIVSEVTTNATDLYMEIMYAGGVEEYLQKLPESKRDERRNEIESVYALFNFLEETHNANSDTPINLYEAMQNNLLGSIKINLGNKYIRSIADIFRDLITPTYGSGIVESITSMCEPLIEYNGMLNNIASVMFDGFYEAYGNSIKSFIEKNDRVPREDELKEILKDLRPLMPRLPSFFESRYKNKDAGILFLEKERNVDEWFEDLAKVTYQYMEAERKESAKGNVSVSYKLFDTKLTTSLRGFGKAGVRPSIMPTHYKDALGMLVQQAFFDDFTGIFDAKATNAIGHSEGSRLYNGTTLGIGKEFFVLGRVYETLKSIYTDMYKEGTPEYESNQKMFFGSDPLKGVAETVDSISELQKALIDKTQFANQMATDSRDNLIEVDADTAIRAVDSMGITTTDEVQVGMAKVNLQQYLLQQLESQSSREARENAQENGVPQEDLPKPKYNLTRAMYYRILGDKVKEAEFYRQAFFEAEPYSINMAGKDGSSGSGVIENVEQKIIDALKKETLEDASEELQANYGGKYIPDTEYEELLREANTTHEGRMKLIEAIAEFDRSVGIKSNEEDVEYYKKLFSELSTEALDKTTFIVRQSDRESNGRQFDNTIDVQIKRKQSQTTFDELMSRGSLDLKSGLEILSHEMLHKLTNFAFRNAPLEAKNLISKIRVIHNRAAEVLTWQDFMPNTYDRNKHYSYREYHDSGLAKAERMARNTYDYIFNNKDGSDRSLKEFIAYALTSKTVRNALANMPMNKRVPVVDAIKNFFKGILDLVWNSKPFKEVFGRADEVIRGETRFNVKDNALAEMRELVRELSELNEESLGRTRTAPMRAYLAMNNFFNNTISMFNKGLTPLTKNVFTIADKFSLIENYKVSNVPVLNIARLGLFLPFSKKARQLVIRSASEILHLSEQGVFLNTIREFQTPDEFTRMRDRYNMFRRMAEQASNELSDTVVQDIMSALGKTDVTELEGFSVTKMLNADIQCLASSNITDNEIEHIRELLRNNDALNSEITAVEQKILQSKELTRSQKDWILNQALALAHYIRTGRGNAALCLNAKDIIANIPSKSKAHSVHIDLVDKLITYYVLNDTESELKLQFSEFNNAGIRAIIANHKEYVSKFNKSTRFTDIHGTEYSSKPDWQYIKGRVDSPYKYPTDTIISAADAASLAKEGYRPIQKLNVVGAYSYTLYKRDWATSKRRTGATLALKGMHNAGESLFNKEVDECLVDNIMAFKDSINATANKDMTAMVSRRLTKEQIAQLAKDMVPTHLKTNEEGGISVSDFQITTPLEARYQLGMKTNGIVALGNMAGRQSLDMQADRDNINLFTFLLEDMKQNMNEHTHTLKTDSSVKYVVVDPMSADFRNNPFLVNAWKQLPQELKDLFLKTASPLRIRASWLHHILGTPDYSLTDSKLFKNSSPVIRKNVALAEEILKFVAQQAKRSILFRIPTVLIDNCLGNTAYLIAQGISPIEAVKLQWQYTKHTREYIKTKQELKLIQLRMVQGTANDFEKRSFKRLSDALKENPVHELMTNGFYQAITSELKMSDMEATSRIGDMLHSNSRWDKLNPTAQKAVRNVFMTEGTFFYDTLYKATEYSDFVARCALYHHRMKGISKNNPEYEKKKQETFNELWDAFVNYDTPQTTFEQYMNDIGLFFFTKYFKRTQRAIAHNIVNNPAGIIAMLGVQANVMPLHSIFDQTVLNKNYGALIRNPYNNFIMSGIPVPIQGMLGI